MMKRVSLWHNHSQMFWNFLMFGKYCRLSLKVLLLILIFLCSPPIPLPLSIFPFLLPLLALQRHSDLPPSLSFANPLHLSSIPLLLAAWPSPWSLHHVDVAVLMALRPRVNGIYPSHAHRPLRLYPLSSPGSSMSLHTFPLVSPGLHEALHFLLQVVTGISEGWMQGLPWQVLPFTRSVVKE